MAVVINGNGTVTGISVGGLPDGIVDAGTLATNSVDSAELIDGAVDDSHMASISGRKNLIINGGFDVWQRGTSFSGLSVYSYFADRWQCAISTTCSRSTDTPTDEGFNYSAKLEAGSGGNILRMMLEDSYRLLGSNSFTFSFWIKGSVASTGGMDVGDQQSKTFSITTSWTKITQNFTEISTTAHGGTADDYFDITSSVAGDFYITGVQLELGSVATEFEHRSYGEELALCQRYYHIIGKDSPASSVIMTGAFSVGSQELVGFIWHPVEMRTNPTFTLVGITNMSYRKNDGGSFALLDNTPPNTYSTTKCAHLWFSSQTGLGTGDAGFIRNNGSAATVSFDAEL